jgi:two-component system response regulator AtoC
MSYSFPGNVRELINMVHNAVARNRSAVLGLRDFPRLEPGNVAQREIVRKIGENQFALHGIFHEFPTIETLEALLIEKAMSLAEGNRSFAAKLLGLSRPTLQRKLEMAAEKKN